MCDKVFLISAGMNVYFCVFSVHESCVIHVKNHKLNLILEWGKEWRERWSRMILKKRLLKCVAIVRHLVVFVCWIFFLCCSHILFITFVKCFYAFVHRNPENVSTKCLNVSAATILFNDNNITKQKKKRNEKGFYFSSFLSFVVRKNALLSCRRQ